MPWYWTDDLTRVLRDRGRLDPAADTTSSAYPQGLRATSESIEEAVDELLDSGEIPLAA